MNGDIVVARESTSESAIRYTVRQLPGVVQFSEPSQEDAVRRARAFAQHHAVDLWYCDGPTEQLLESHRRARV